MHLYPTAQQLNLPTKQDKNASQTQRTQIEKGYPESKKKKSFKVGFWWIESKREVIIS